MNKLVLVLCGALLATNVWADEDDSFVNYDAIVNELKADAEDVPPPVDTEADWSEVALHAGMALTTSYRAISVQGGGKATGLLKGFEAHFGANLFSRDVRGELAFRNYTPEQMGSGVRTDLREFEARAIFLPYLRDKTLMRMGFGLTARDFSVESRQSGRDIDSSDSTIASAILLGFEHRVSRAVSVGPDLVYRTALSSSTVNPSAWDAALRLNATF